VNINTIENDIMRSSRNPKKIPRYNPYKVIFKPVNGILTGAEPSVRNACNINVIPTIQKKGLICLRNSVTGTLDSHKRTERNKNIPARTKIFRLAVVARIKGISVRNFVRGSNRCI